MAWVQVRMPQRQRSPRPLESGKVTIDKVLNAVRIWEANNKSQGVSSQWLSWQLNSKDYAAIKRALVILRDRFEVTYREGDMGRAILPGTIMTTARLREWMLASRYTVIDEFMRLPVGARTDEEKEMLKRALSGGIPKWGKQWTDPYDVSALVDLENWITKAAKRQMYIDPFTPARSSSAVATTAAPILQANTATTPVPTPAPVVIVSTDKVDSLFASITNRLRVAIKENDNALVEDELFGALYELQRIIEEIKDTRRG